MAFRVIEWAQVTEDDVGAPLPVPPPVGYRIHVDGVEVNDIPNIANPTAPQATINVAPGPHTVEVFAYHNVSGELVGQAQTLNFIQPSGVPAAPATLTIQPE